ncbi:hypothetical protein M409DRAFT_21620 [Zasmidium cellare ATCC 36951]|uniref:Apple domain-containing protein n=1 Tax=Zasmidium cellare ATCC 36951 TaxID=1080233 RepID=A0A6A6CRR5_ZASCE|nr:uncharacterized protein M409DRAFT_21620 [Zasmidium cellare ATCC 36951]KAF2168176.1 hypothetical protein M409DRAFT_21620 [Zasmidium cellare ATCC 36951]
MRKLAINTAMLLALASTAAGQSQVVMTIAVPYCPTYSSSLAPYSSILPDYSSSALSYGSMIPPVSQTANTGASISQSPSAVQLSTSSSSSIASPSSTSYIDRYGQVYELYTNTGISGNTIEAEPERIRRRQASGPSLGSTLELCLEDCSATAQCQATSYLGTSCLLYSSVRGSTFLLGGVAGFNVARFNGFANDTGDLSTSSTSSVLRSSGTTSIDATATSFKQSKYAKSQLLYFEGVRDLHGCIKSL